MRVAGHVEELVVTVNADHVIVKNAPDGVHVVPRMRVEKWLLRHGDIHPPETFDAIDEAARRSTSTEKNLLAPVRVVVRAAPGAMSRQAV